MGCIPPEQDGPFVARLEQVLQVYKRPYDPRRPVVCMDEQPYQLISESRPALAMSMGQPRRIDHEYVREGTCTCGCLLSRWAAGVMSGSRRGKR
jgi:hypothetical protein